ncbi:MAG: alpha/beta hydrolase, partial [Veillonella sp.]|nr:alpha/beta hydrolase [Veillonella sp.]
MKRFSTLLMGAGLMTGLLSFNNYVLAGPATTSNTYNRVDPAYQEVLKTSFIGQMVINNDQDLADYDAKLPHDFIGDYKPMTDTVPASDQDPAVELYVYRPQATNKADGPLPILYYSHGGGYILRGALYNTNAYQAMADRFNMIVVTPKYRLTTEAPFPAALTDAYRGLQYTYANGQNWGGDTSR